VSRLVIQTLVERCVVENEETHTFPKPTACCRSGSDGGAVGLGNVNAARHARVDRCSLRRTSDWSDQEIARQKKRDEGLRAPACFGNTWKLVRFQPSRLMKLRSNDARWSNGSTSL
jgi:hypothetical protein